VIGAVVYALLASRLSPLTWAAMLATVPPAVAVFWVGGRRRSARNPEIAISRSRLAPWVVIAALGITLEMVALVQSPRKDFPTLSSIVSPLTGDSTGWYRFGGYLAWFAVGAWMAKR